MRNMQTVRFYPDSGDAEILHVEIPGAIVNIHVGLVDANGHPVSRVDISPEDETRGGDGQGHVWHLADDGRRIIRQTPLTPEETSTENTADAEDTDGNGIRGQWSLVTTTETDDDDIERIAEEMRDGATGGYLYRRD